VIVNRVERTVEHRMGLAELVSYFGPDLVWSPHLPKRTMLGVRRQSESAAYPHLVTNRADGVLASVQFARSGSFAREPAPGDHRTPRMSNRISVMTAETRSDPRQPKRLEKKRSIACAFSGWPIG
jgi:hypothetical protein